MKAPSEESDYWRKGSIGVAFFDQPCRDVMNQRPGKEYPVVSGKKLTRKAMKREC